MSFLAGRLAATEGAFFLQESKNAAGRLAQKLPPPSSSAAAASPVDAADVLPEILRHSLPLRGSASAAAAADPSLSAASKWLLPRTSTSPSSSRASPDALNPLRAYVSLPQATFGPRRWQLPDEQPHYSASTSTANDLRQDRHPPIDSEKLKAAIAGYSQIGKAFVIATTMIFGGAAVLFLYTAHKLQLHSTDDIRTKGRDVIQPGADILREQMIPLRTWAEKMSRKWHFEGEREAKEKTIVKELSKAFGARTSS